MWCYSIFLQVSLHNKLLTVKPNVNFLKHSTARKQFLERSRWSWKQFIIFSLSVELDVNLVRTIVFLFFVTSYHQQIDHYARKYLCYIKLV